MTYMPRQMVSVNTTALQDLHCQVNLIRPNNMFDTSQTFSKFTNMNSATCVLETKTTIKPRERSFELCQISLKLFHTVWPFAFKCTWTNVITWNWGILQYNSSESPVNFSTHKQYLWTTSRLYLNISFHLSPFRVLLCFLSGMNAEYG